MPLNKTGVIAVAFIASLTFCESCVAAQARLFLSRRGPSIEGCLGPRVGEVPYLEMPGGGSPTVHLWLNVDDLPPNSAFRELGWSIEYSGAYITADESEVTNPINPAADDARWNVEIRQQAALPYVLYGQGGISFDSPSIGTTTRAKLDPAYDADSNSFHLGSFTTDFITPSNHAFLYLRTGRLSLLKSGEIVDLRFGDSEFLHPGNGRDKGDPITTDHRFADALIGATGRPNFFGINIGPTEWYTPDQIESRIDLTSGPYNVAYCASGEWFGKIAVDHFRGEEVEVYIDFAGIAGDGVATYLGYMLGDDGTEFISDVSGTNPLGNGIDYDLHVRFRYRPLGESFVLAFETEFDLPGYPIANLAVVPEPTSQLIALGALLACCASARRRLRIKGEQARADNLS